MPTKTAGLVRSPVTGHPEDSLQHVTVDEAAQRIEAAKDRTLVLLYDYWTEPALAAFPAFVAAVIRCHRAGMEVLAFSTDRTGYALRQLPGFLAEQQAPFGAVHLIPWRPGQLRPAMAPLGVRIDSTWSSPILALREGSSGVRLQIEGWETFATSTDRRAAACEAR